MALALFDLDNTLLAGDSDHAWGEFLCRRGLVEVDSYRARNDAFYQDYLDGCLDVQAYQDFCQELLGRSEMAQLASWHREFMAEFIEPIVLAKGEALLRRHQEAGDRVVIITATNRFITGPIAARLGVETLLATECGMEDGRYIGRSVDVPCFQEGKVVRLERWLAENGLDLQGSWFYSDSRNDLPLLLRVSNPVAVDPDAVLRAEAEARGWPVISLR
ncbi:MULTISPECIES: HAD family hydrolase [Pseudomonas]|uniref:Histidinol-phosphatase n=1 Tax=Pseudomonas flexibilis TaxID=706570 RepID=A0A1N6XLQ7_9PSED|nr:MULTISPECIES: HAD family hydrolase [Pseudomonas]KHL69119.1 phosphoserine phosphatase [Pseudomonas flexibilis]SIR03316.1 HAD-superfamily subfamily IB hydrolase, TIGR01490 [Pseudomonas flexibilis]